MNCWDLFKYWYLVGYVAYNWVRVGIQPPNNYWVVVVKWLHNCSLLWSISYYVCSDQPHDVHPRLTTKLSFPEVFKFTCLNSLPATFQFTTLTTPSKTKPYKLRSSIELYKVCYSSNVNPPTSLEFLIISTLLGKGTSTPPSTARFWTSQRTNLLCTHLKLTHSLIPSFNDKEWPEGPSVKIQYVKLDNR